MLILQLILLRVKQLFRTLKEGGIVRLLFLAAIIIFSMVYFFNILKNEQSSYFVLSGIIIAFFAIHNLRKDKKFITKITNKHTFVYFAEYIIMASPFLIFFIILNKNFLLLIFFPALFVVCLTNFSVPQYSLNNFVIRIIPSRFFEWKSGIRKNFIFIVAFLIISFGLCFFVATVPIFLLLFTFIVSSFFQESESRDIIEINNYSSKKFIFKKLKDNLLLFSLISGFFIILFLIFNSKYWYIIAAEFAVSISIIFLSIVQKYSLYKPNISLKSNMVMVSIAQSSFIFPFLIPVIWIMCVYYFFKAKQNLVTYLYD